MTSPFDGLRFAFGTLTVFPVGVTRTGSTVSVPKAKRRPSSGGVMDTAAE